MELLLQRKPATGEARGCVAVKPGVLFTIVAPAGYLILGALKTAADALALTLTITSACDGLHSGIDDPHHLGRAYDVRSHDIDPALRPQVLQAIMNVLGWDHFYGFLESPGTSNEHFHIQQARDTAFTIEDYLAA